MLSTLKDLSRSTRVSRAILSISGVLLILKWSNYFDEYRRKQYPDEVLPARPALCLAED